jgi:hypothetical protein
MAQASNPVGLGIANFIGALGDEAEKSSDAKRNEAGKEQFENWKTEFMNQHDANTNRGKEEAAKIHNQGTATVAKTRLAAHGGTGSDMSQSEKYFLKRMSDGSTKLSALTKSYLYPNPMLDKNVTPQLAKELNAMTPQQRKDQAERDYGISNTEEYNFIKDPQNISHYKELLAKVSGHSAGTPNPMAQPNQATAPKTINDLLGGNSNPVTPPQFQVPSLGANLPGGSTPPAPAVSAPNPDEEPSLTLPPAGAGAPGM